MTSQLLINIFEHNTPLHDGAVVIRGNRVTAATCYLPLSDNMDISKALGTRHRAAVGVSEATDSVTLVVSEETGRVSVAVSGRLKSVKDGDELRDMLSVLVKRETETQVVSEYGREDAEMKEKLTNNLAIKLIALFCAFFVWLAVVNVANPIKVSTREVPVTITNDQVLEQADLAYDVVGKKRR